VEKILGRNTGSQTDIGFHYPIHIFRKTITTIRIMIKFLSIFNHAIHCFFIISK